MASVTTAPLTKDVVEVLSVRLWNSNNGRRRDQQIESIQRFLNGARFENSSNTKLVLSWNHASLFGISRMAILTEYDASVDWCQA